MDVIVRPATGADRPDLVSLFEAYRAFYQRSPDPAGADAFIGERLERQDSVILVAERDGRLIGFTQLYFSFSSTRMRRTFVLNDLFVALEGRRSGAGRALLAAAEEHARSVGAFALTLSTALDNRQAQALYESAGWGRDQQFCVYHRLLD